jgi:hypothetical protein
MATLRVGPEADQVLKLLVGLGHAPAADIMRRYGFAEADRQEGWRHLHAIASRRLPRRAPARSSARLLERLEAWQSVWFPVARDALRARFPAVEVWLFRDLSQDEADGPEAAVALFLQRLLRMPFEPALAPGGADARELLARRGIDAASVRIASELLELACTAQDVDASCDPGEEAALRSWYSKWSEVAQAAIQDRALLRALGFGSS